MRQTLIKESSIFFPKNTSGRVFKTNPKSLTVGNFFTTLFRHVGGQSKILADDDEYERDFCTYNSTADIEATDSNSFRSRMSIRFGTRRRKSRRRQQQQQQQPDEQIVRRAISVSLEQKGGDEGGGQDAEGDHGVAGKKGSCSSSSPDRRKDSRVSVISTVAENLVENEMQVRVIEMKLPYNQLL